MTDNPGVIFAYTTDNEARIPQSLMIVREVNGDLFLTASYLGARGSVTLPAAHKARLLAWLRADVEGDAAEAAARREGRVVAMVQPALRVVPADGVA